MTIEEAIQWFKENPFMHKDHEPFKMAIKALKHMKTEQKCHDCKHFDICDIRDSNHDFCQFKPVTELKKWPIPPKHTPITGGTCIAVIAALLDDEDEDFIASLTEYKYNSRKKQ